MTSNDEYVLQLLREKGYVSAEQLEVASQAMREGNETTLDVLVASGTLTEDDVLGTIADMFGIKYVSIDPSAIDPEVGKEIAPEIARKYGVAPVMADAESVPPEDLFRFSPSVKGSARWAASDMVEFLLDAGALKPGRRCRTGRGQC